MDTIFLKLGGSIITDKTKPFHAEMDNIASLAEEIAEAMQKEKFNLIIGNGGGSYGHVLAKEYGIKNGIKDEITKKGFVLTHDAVARLNQLIVSALLEKEINAFSIQPSAVAIGKSGIVNSMYTDVIERLLSLNIVPVLYGDAIYDEVQGCMISSTESQCKFLFKKIPFKKAVMVSIVDGVCTSDPNKNSDAKLINNIDENNISDVLKMLGGSHGVDVTGGMKDKIEKMYDLAKQGMDVVIVNGLKKGRLKDVLLGKETVCTKIKGVFDDRKKEK